MINKIKNNIWIVLIGIGIVYAIGRYFYKTPSVINGETAPNITSIQLNGEPFDLKLLRGSYVLIDFWGSWCGPCVEETPQLRRIYELFHDKKFKDAANFEIVSFGVEKNRSRWEATIQQLNIGQWKHISDFQYLNSPITKAYGVRVIPSKILLNTEGVIVGVNQSEKEIEDYLISKIK